MGVNLAEFWAKKRRIQGDCFGGQGLGSTGKGYEDDEVIDIANNRSVGQ